MLFMAEKSRKERVSDQFLHVETKDGASFNGLMMPGSDDSILVLKLWSGYNVGVIRKNIVKLTKIQGQKKVAEKVEKKALKMDTSLPTIAILHTGGTIASEIDYETGGVVARFTPEELLAMFPEIQNFAQIKSSQVMSMMSEDMRFSHYQLLAKAVEKEIRKGVAGVIIGHGTDTLAITAAALSFMFDHLPIPVIFVGAQRSSDRGGTDAYLNMLNAAYFITHGNFKGVGLCMHATTNDEDCVILPATKTKKLHTSRRDAFQPVNALPIARVNVKQKKIEYVQAHHPGTTGKLTLRDGFEEKVAVIKAYPNMFSHFIDTAIEKKYKGIVLEGSGIGQAPTNIKENLPVYNSLKKFIGSGGVVVLTSNCIFGEVHPYIYKNCRRLQEIGVIFGKDMLTETALVKLAWLLGNYPKKEVAHLMTENLKGEINSRLLYQELP